MRNSEYIRTIIFGIEDSLVSTTGLVAGLAAGTSNKTVVIMGGIVGIVVEATSMGASEYLSDDALNQARKRGRAGSQAAISGLLMMSAYFFAGLIPIAPVILMNYPASLYASVIMALIGIFTLGYLKGKYLHTDPWRGALKMVLVGGLTTLFGLFVGLAFKV